MERWKNIISRVLNANVKEYVFKGSFAPSENSFSAWYVPKYDMILKFKYAYHADFIETYFGVNENKFPDKKVDKIIKEARKELKSILGTTIFYKEFYNIGWVRVNKNGSHCAVSASSPNSNLSDFTTMVNYAIDLNVQEISIEFRNDYDDLVEPKEHMTEEEVAKAFKHSSMLTSKRGQIMKDRIVANELKKIAKIIKADYGDVPTYSKDEMDEFIKYFMSFYGNGGLYPIENLSRKDIIKGVEIRLKKRPSMEFVGDSADRELVRDIVLGWRKQLKGKK